MLRFERLLFGSLRSTFAPRSGALAESWIAMTRDARPDSHPKIPLDTEAPQLRPSDEQLAEFDSLVDGFDGSSLPSTIEQSQAEGALFPSLSDDELNRLVKARLGMASSLFEALRSRHEPTARHCLRVAITYSAWAHELGLAKEERDAIEVAALLHDIGKIGVPDQILLNPTSLSPQEASVMAGHWNLGRSILQSSCASQAVLDTFVYAGAWYNGTNGDYDRYGEEIPLGARMLAIVDAFDSMVNEQTFRPAIPAERAFNELYRFAGFQFDPELVQSFVEHMERSWRRPQPESVRQWLETLDPQLVHRYWWLADAVPETPLDRGESIFHKKLLENMYDAVVFVDFGRRVISWNHGAERLTGIASASIWQQRWSPEVLDLRDEEGQPIPEKECPLVHAIETGVQSVRRLSVAGRGGRHIAVDVHAIPVIAPDGVHKGATLLLHDVSPQISLEARCQDLFERATKDPLTQVANRAEFDRLYGEIVAAHQDGGLPCCLIVTDIDRFKQVNDTFGHSAGDEVIRSLAALLRSSCRPGDLAARFGGEEFVIVCADCTAEAAVRRADEMRQAFSATCHTVLAGRRVTASFGVTELQPGDTAEMMFNRADRAVLDAKEAGRNRVVRLGTGHEPEVSTPLESRLPPKGDDVEPLLHQYLVSEAPLNVCRAKLRGFVADHNAEILAENELAFELLIGTKRSSLLSRSDDRPVPLTISVQFAEERQEPGSVRSGGAARTEINLTIRPQKKRERRAAVASVQARQVAIGFRAYLMASDRESGQDDRR